MDGEGPKRRYRIIILVCWTNAVAWEYRQCCWSILSLPWLMAHWCGSIRWAVTPRIRHTHLWFASFSSHFSVLLRPFANSELRASTNNYYYIKLRISSTGWLHRHESTLSRWVWPPKKYDSKKKKAIVPYFVPLWGSAAFTVVYVYRGPRTVVAL